MELLSRLFAEGEGRAGNSRAAFGFGVLVGAVAWSRLGPGALGRLAGTGSGVAPPAVEYDKEETPLRVIRKAETILRMRTNRIILVLERCTDPRNNQAVMRTMESLGIQHVWTVIPVEEKVPSSTNKFTRGEGLSTVGRSSVPWLTTREFTTTAECIVALREEGAAIWATDLSQQAIPLDSPSLTPPPPRVAVVIGRESDGVSKEMLEAADKRIYLPLYGFTESLNLSVAAAMVVQNVMAKLKDRGCLPGAELRDLRARWFELLAKTPSHWQTYKDFIDDPPEPFGDVRVPEAFRTPYVKKAVRKRQAKKEAELRQQAAGAGVGAEN